MTIESICWLLNFWANIDLGGRNVNLISFQLAFRFVSANGRWKGLAQAHFWNDNYMKMWLVRRRSGLGNTTRNDGSIDGRKWSKDHPGRASNLQRSAFSCFDEGRRLVARIIVRSLWANFWVNFGWESSFWRGCFLFDVFRFEEMFKSTRDQITLNWVDLNPEPWIYAGNLTSADKQGEWYA